jgi:hypothetical protein
MDFTTEDLFDPNDKGAKQASVVIYGNMKKVLERINPQSLRETQIAKDRWNNYIRENLKNELGFKLAKQRNTKERNVQGIKLDVYPSVPAPLITLFFKYDTGIWEMILEEKVIQQAKSSIDYNQERAEKIIQLTGADTKFRADLQGTQEYLDFLLSYIASKKQEIVVELKKIETDIGGRYNVRKNKVELFWLGIAFLSALTKKSIEEITYVILSHEMAHAYTHLGYDMDGQNWDSVSFEKADPFITEGIAQFYTNVLCQKNTSVPGAVDAFHSLLDTKVTHYNDFKHWLPSTVERKNEIVRLALINTRRKNILKYGQFMNEIEIATTGLSLGN